MSNFFKGLLFDYTGQFQWSTFLLLALLLLMLIIVVLLVVGTVCTIKDAITASRFITSNKITRGIVTRYYIHEDEEISTFLPMRFGNATVLFPHHFHGEQRYYVELCCTVNSKQYLLQFAIKEEDYESEAVGTEIAIQSNWFCEGYGAAET